MTDATALCDGNNRLVVVYVQPSMLSHLFPQINDFGDNTGNPYRTFEKYLERLRPAVAFPFYGYGTPSVPRPPFCSAP